LRFARVDEKVIDSNVMWEHWKGSGNGEKAATAEEIAQAPTVSEQMHVVISYISRQGGNKRKLNAASHEVRFWVGCS